MADDVNLYGVYAPVLTPFTDDGVVDPRLFSGFCRWLNSEGVGLAVFGTNSEANSLTVEEKITLLNALRSAGIEGSALMPGTGALSIGDAVRLTKAALDVKAAAVLVLPPFYYKPVGDGLFAYYSELVERVGSAALKVVLYHIPRLTGVPITAGLVEQLLKAYPKTFVGIKDSSNDIGNTATMIRSFPELRIFAGSDEWLLEAMRLGGQGCISATANVNPAAIGALRQNWRSDKAEAEQAGLTKVRRIFEAYPMIAALKAAAAHYGGEPSFAITRVPLLPLKPDLHEKLIAELDGHGFAMSGLAASLKAAISG
jgi:4-hydroxy-tetrahydrodipicolinate synthase